MLKRSKLAIAAVLLLLGVQIAPAATAATPSLKCATPTNIVWDRQKNPYAGIEALPRATWTDVWTQQGAESIKWCAFDDWTATARQDNSAETGVKAYPDSEQRWTDNATCASQPPLGSFHRLKSTYGHVSPNGGSWDWAYDAFINGGQCHLPLTELMVFTEWRAVSLPTPQLSTTIDGVGYDVFYAHFQGSTGYYIQMRLQQQNTAGAVNFKHLFKYLYGVGLLKRADTMAFLKYGVEILSTCADPIPAGCTGVNRDFSLNAFETRFSYR